MKKIKLPNIINVKSKKCSISKILLYKNSMIIKICTTSIALLFSVTAFAQKGFNLQLILQPGTSIISGNWMVPEEKIDPEHNNTPRKITFGFEGGINGGYDFSDNFGLSLGLYYSHQGQDYKNYTWVITNTTYERKIKLSSLKIPLKLNFNSSQKKNTSIIGFVGIYYGALIDYNDKTIETYNNTPGAYDTYVIKGNTSVSTLTNNNSITYKSDLTENIYKNDFGLTIGTGVQRKISQNLVLMVVLNYERGITDIRNLSSKYKDSSDIYYSANNVNTEIEKRNSMFGLIIGLKKSFGNKNADANLE